MKKGKLITVVLLIRLNVCADDDEKETDEGLIVGTWKLIIDDEAIEFVVFKSDGTMTLESDTFIVDYARYKVKGNILYLLWGNGDTIEDESDEWWDNNNLSDWDDIMIFELTSTSLILDWVMEMEVMEPIEE